MKDRLAALTEAGTAIWLDQLSRELITSGELARLVREDSLRGVTSNPAIFEKAIVGAEDYDDQIRACAEQGLNAREIYEAIAIEDVRSACDVLRPVWDEADGGDGFVSLEVEPAVAHDTDATIAQARDFGKRVDRPNLMVKIPATDEGVPAIEAALAEGININITLLFAVESYENVIEAYLKAMEARMARGESLDVRSVASFFVSRVDTEVDKRLAELGREDLRGTAAVANARDAYSRFRRVFEGERFAELREAGCPVQRPLWASTGVKDPKYRETKYVETLVGPSTVNTMPMPTLLACAEQLEVTGATAAEDPSAELEALRHAGIDMTDVTRKLLSDGIAKFEESFDSLLESIESTREAIVTGRPPTIESSIPDELEPAIAKRVAQAVRDQVAARIWRRDESLWGGPGLHEIGDRLGWLTISEKMLEHAAELSRFAAEVRADGFTDAVLLGMGGSSLGPEVIRRSFGELPGGLRLHVLDSTDPGAVLELERTLDLDKTLFVASSKSGGTIETLSQLRYYYGRYLGGADFDQERGHHEGRGDPAQAAGGHFVAVTDPGSPLVDLARELGFRRVFENDPEIGGRYSVLSLFGLVPAALMGVDVEKLLHGAQVAEQNCTSFGASESNSGLWLGVTMGELALQGRDKLTFVVSERIASFGLWAEQLIAESTGKEGKGIVPVAGEPVGGPDDYGDDRVFVYLRDADQPDEQLDERVRELARAGQPVVTLTTGGPEDLGRVFFFAEFATAVAGWVLGINPFDQPNVQEAKDNTARLLEADALPQVEAGDLSELLDGAQPPRYVALLGFVTPSEEVDAAVAELRAALRDRTGATTTFGYGPRYLHSTGQLHKGGPPTGLFLELLGDGDRDAEIPEAGYGFRHLRDAQAIGDLQTLRDHGLPAVQVRLEGDPAAAVRALAGRVARGGIPG